MMKSHEETFSASGSETLLFLWETMHSETVAAYQVWEMNRSETYSAAVGHGPWREGWGKG